MTDIVTPPTINALPPAPQPADTPSEFDSKAFALLAAQVAMVGDFNSAAAATQQNATAANERAVAAASSASAANVSASTASTQAGVASGAATTATNKAAEATASALSASKLNLGNKASPPTTDNQGAALLAGALYWDTSLPGMRSWNGGAWVTLPAATAGSVSFTPAGTGAVERTAQDKLRERVSVKDFGAVCDGVADDTVAVQRAFEYAGSIGVKVTHNGGICLLSNTVVWDVTAGFEFEAAPGAVFKASPLFPVDAKMFNPTASVAGQSLAWTGGVIDGRDMPARAVGAPDLLYINSPNHRRVRIEGTHFLVNDNRSGAAGDGALFLAEGEDYFVSRCIFQGAVDSGVYISGNSAETLGRRVVVTENTFLECKAVGVISKRKFEDHVVANNIIVRCGTGIVIGGEADTTKLPGRKATITGNILKQCTRGIDVRIADGSVIQGNRIEDYGLDESLLPVSGTGIRVMGAKNCTVTGNVVINNGGITPAAGSSAILCGRFTVNGINYDSTQNLITGNNVKNSRTAFIDDANANQNLWLNNYAKDFVTYFTINASSESRFVGWDGARQTCYFGESGAGPASVANVFYESNGELTFQHCVPSTAQVQWLVGDESSNAVARMAYAHTTDRWSWRAGGSNVAFQISASGPVLNSYTVAALPTTSLAPGTLAYASDGRKAGDGAGLGTGVMVFRDGGNWISVDSGAPVTA